MTDLPARFAQRLREGVPGLSAVDWGPARPLGRKAWMATGQMRHGARRQGLPMGCRTPDGLLRFVTLTLPTHRAEAERHSRSGAAVLEPACLQAASTRVATACAAAQAMKPSLASKANPFDPADALKEADIESVPYAWQQRHPYDGLKFMEWTCLLMKDGSARDDVPKQAPADFDLAADRRAQPRRWGRWQRSGKGSTTSVGGPGIAGGLRSASSLTVDDLEGSHHIDGWSITLRHRSGQVQRSFFSAESSRYSIGLAGAELDRRQPR